MTRCPRILHVLKLYRPMFTGEGVFTERCTAAMQALAPEVEHDLLVTATPAPERPLPICSTLRRVFYLDTPPAPAWRHELALLWWFLRNLHRYDTVHFRTHADWYFLTYLLCRLTGRRLVLSATLDDSVPVLVGLYRPMLRPLVRRLFRVFSAFVSISPKLQGETARVMDPARCALVPCGIVIPEPNPALGRAVRQRLGIPDQALVLVFVGGLCARKDPLLLVRLLPEIAKVRADTHLLLVGPPLEPDHVRALTATAAELGVADRVVLTGEVPDANPYLDAADIMVFGSRLEGFGTVVPEAQAKGLPVVVRRLPGVNEQFVLDGETGFFFDDDATYVDRVGRLARDAALRRRIGEAARRHVTAHFGMDTIARRYLDLYAVRDVTPLPAIVPPALGERQEPSLPGEEREPPLPGEDREPPFPGEEREPALPGEGRELSALPTTASVLVPRFHLRADTDRLDRPVLLTIIDAEEAFDWSRPFSRSATDVRSMAQQEPAHRVFERHGVVPTYMVDYPVATQEVGRQPLREWLADGRCDIGTQLHPWVTPPFLEEVSRRNSYPGSLPLALEHAKIRTLTETLEETFGTRPRIYRAGRYGAGPRTADILCSLGYEADSSVMPAWNFGPQDGPDFSALPAAPFWVDAARTLLEIPGTAAAVGRLAGRSPWVDRAAFGGICERLGITAALARTRLLERIKLTPEGITIAEAKRLVRHMAAHGHKVFVLTYHTPSLVPGNTPYVRSEADLQRFLAWLEEFYDFFVTEIGGRNARWQEVRAALARAPAEDPARPVPVAA